MADLINRIETQMLSRSLDSLCFFWLHSITSHFHDLVKALGWSKASCSGADAVMGPDNVLECHLSLVLVQNLTECTPWVHPSQATFQTQPSDPLRPVLVQNEKTNGL